MAEYEIPLISTNSSFGSKTRFDANVGGCFFSGDTEKEARQKAEQYIRDHGWLTRAEAEQMAKNEVAVWKRAVIDRLQVGAKLFRRSDIQEANPLAMR